MHWLSWPTPSCQTQSTIQLYNFSFTKTIARTQAVSNQTNTDPAMELCRKMTHANPMTEANNHTMLTIVSTRSGAFLTVLYLFKRLYSFSFAAPPAAFFPRPTCPWSPATSIVQLQPGHCGTQKWFFLWVISNFLAHRIFSVS